MNVFLSILTAIPILAGMHKGLRAGKPNLLMICFGLLVWFVIAPLYTALPLAGIGNWSPAITKAQVLGMIWSTLIVGIAWWFGIWKERRETWFFTDDFGQHVTVPVERSIAHPRVMLVASFVLTLVGFAASALFAIIGGGQAWLRVEGNQFAGMGTLGLLGSNTLLFPLVVWYLFLRGYRMLAPLYVIAAVQLLMVSYSFLYSGVTGGPLAALLPFGILWCIRGVRLSTARFAVMCAGGYGAVWLLRFMRLLGQLTFGGQVKVDVSSAVELFENSNLRPSTSFGEFFWFAKVVEHVDGGGQMMHAKAYLLTLLQFVPAYLWPAKAEFVADARVDAFVRDIVLKGLYGGLIPVGMYGEAYLSYGLVAIVIVAALIGWLTGFVDSRFRSALWGVPGHLVCALMCPVLIATCRGASQFMLTGIAPILVFALMCRILRPMGRRGAESTEADIAAQTLTAA